jgi:succinylarginine dihydrolase
VIREINFDGLIGPSHNYAALSPGNCASAANAGTVSRPRAAALQGIAKMRTAIGLGLAQGVLLPHDRPATGWLRQLGFAGTADGIAAAAWAADPLLFARAMSASPMWTANAATVSPAADTADGRCHMTVANLSAMPHRSHEAAATLAQLRLAFAGPAFAVHSPVPSFGDEGAANHMRVGRPGEPGVEIFVYGVDGGGFPARQNRAASEAVARTHGLDPARTLFVEQATEAIRAGAFHNDVVAVANDHVVFAHEAAFADPARFAADLARVAPDVVLIEVPASAVSLGEAIASYLFNSQLVTVADGMALILPTEAQDNPRVAAYLATLIAGNGPIRRVHFVEVRESMRNGGGPACLRLRVAADPATVDPRFLVDPAKLDRLAAVVDDRWPEEIAPDDLGRPALWAACRAARAALLAELDLDELGIS